VNDPTSQQSAEQATAQAGSMAQTLVPGSAIDTEALVQRQLLHVGAAYGVIFVLLFFYAWRLTSLTRRLSERVDELEHEAGGKH